MSVELAEKLVIDRFEVGVLLSPDQVPMKELALRILSPVATRVGRV